MKGRIASVRRHLTRAARRPAQRAGHACPFNGTTGMSVSVRDHIVAESVWGDCHTHCAIGAAEPGLQPKGCIDGTPVWLRTSATMRSHQVHCITFGGSQGWHGLLVVVLSSKQQSSCTWRSTCHGMMATVNVLVDTAM